MVRFWMKALVVVEFVKTVSFAKRFVVVAFVATMSASVEDAATRFAIYAFVVVEFVSMASVRVEEAAINRVIYESVEVAAPTKRLVMEAFVIEALRTVLDVAVRLLTVTLPVKRDWSEKSDRPEKTAFRREGAARVRFVARP
jgi:hypothetical protein